jgi:hypothetical protein
MPGIIPDLDGFGNENSPLFQEASEMDFFLLYAFSLTGGFPRG